MSCNWLEQLFQIGRLATKKTHTAYLQCVRPLPKTLTPDLCPPPQSSPRSPSSSDSSSDGEVAPWDREGYICAVCLDVYFSPYMCHPCNHIFCEPCLRTLAKNSPADTPCPLCRTTITHVFFQKGEPRDPRHHSWRPSEVNRGRSCRVKRPCADATRLDVSRCVCRLQHRHLGRRLRGGPSCRSPTGDHSRPSVQFRPDESPAWRKTKSNTI